VSVAWGLLSTARINDAILGAARESSLGRIVAVAARDGAHAEAYARANSIPSAHAGYDALLADPDVEAVYISLPNSMHVDWTMRALAAGKHVLCEKPFTRRADEAERAHALARDRGLHLMEGFMYRHNPQTLELARLVGEGAIGELQHVRCSFRFTVGDDADIRMSEPLEGGSLADLGCYCVNIARLLAGEPEAVLATQVVGHTGVDVRFNGELVFGGGVSAQFDTAMTLPFRAEIEVAGSTGSLLVEDPWLCRKPGITLERESGSERIEIAPADSYGLQLDDLSTAIRSGREALLGARDAIGQARTMEALVRAAAEGRRVAVGQRVGAA
jgi:xylose dehydrogenase (NAD/NADP)